MADRICDNCRHYRRLAPGQAGMCFWQWRDLRWNEAAPLMPHDGTCDSFAPDSRTLELASTELRSADK